MKNFCLTQVVTLYVVFLCAFFTGYAQPGGGTRPSFAVWDCDGQGMMAPPPGIFTPSATMALLDSVGLGLPPGNFPTDIKFVFTFKDSAGNPLNVYLPASGTKTYEVAFDLQALPSGVSLSGSAAGLDLTFRMKTQIDQPAAGSFVFVQYEVWTKDATIAGATYEKLNGSNLGSNYKHSLTCNSISGKGRLGRFENTRPIATPNPFSNYIYLETDAGEASCARIMDAQGRILRTISIPPGDRPLRVPTDDLPAGLYFIQKQTPTGVRALPLVKTH
ncbi:MAG: hypothetical protein R3C61_26135 [Bacteroidia bacterium]